MAAGLELGAPRGVYVVGVVAGSPAAKADLRRGDVILRFDGEVVDAPKLAWLASVAGVGRTVEVVGWRDRAERRVAVRMEGGPGLMDPPLGRRGAPGGGGGVGQGGMGAKRKAGRQRGGGGGFASVW